MKISRFEEDSLEHLYISSHKMMLLEFIISFAVGALYWHSNRLRSGLSWTRILTFGHRGLRILGRAVFSIIPATLVEFYGASASLYIGIYAGVWVFVQKEASFYYRNNMDDMGDNMVAAGLWLIGVCILRVLALT